MKDSITSGKAGNRKRESIRLWAVALWLVLWQLLSLKIGQEILLVSPASVAFRLAELVAGIPPAELCLALCFLGFTSLTVADAEMSCRGHSPPVGKSSLNMVD